MGMCHISLVVVLFVELSPSAYRNCHESMRSGEFAPEL
jgi:hypothetical protein